MTPKASRCTQLSELHPVCLQIAAWSVQGFTPAECAVLSNRTPEYGRAGCQGGARRVESAMSGAAAMPGGGLGDLPSLVCQGP